PAGEATRNASHVTDCSISLQIRDLGRATSAGEAAVQKLSDGVVHDLPDLALRRRLAQTKQALQPHRATQHVQEVIRRGAAVGHPQQASRDLAVEVFGQPCPAARRAKLPELLGDLRYALRLRYHQTM